MCVWGAVFSGLVLAKFSAVISPRKNPIRFSPSLRPNCFATCWLLYFRKAIYFDLVNFKMFSGKVHIDHLDCAAQYTNGGGLILASVVVFLRSSGLSGLFLRRRLRTRVAYGQSGGSLQEFEA